MTGTQRFSVGILLVAVLLGGWYVAASAQTVGQNDARRPIVRQTLISATATDETIGFAAFGDLVPSVCKVYIETSAGVSAGTVYVEEAAQNAFAGTWTLVQSVSTTTASVSEAVLVPGPMGAIRTRIETAISGGTVTTRLVCA